VQTHVLNHLPRRHFQIRAKKLLALILAKNEKRYEQQSDGFEPTNKHQRQTSCIDKQASKQTNKQTSK